MIEPMIVPMPEMDDRQETALNLELALEATRMEHNGITLDYVARIITKTFDAAEVRALINGLERYKDTPKGCGHVCTSDCKWGGCNCDCGEFHCEPEGKCRYIDEGDCPNHPKK